ncbi:MAG: hypothetical protein Q9225_008035, partial [Loekoesia sp. 1 TL-2023]
MEPSGAEADFVAQIVREASGVFIWVRLVMDLVAQEIIDGTPFSMLKRKVSQLPSELKELYRLTVERIKPGYHTETWIMFQAVLCALQPLSLAALVGLTDMNLRLFSASQNSSSVKGYVDLFGLSPTSEQLRRLNSRSGGLLEAVLPLTQNPCEGVEEPGVSIMVNAPSKSTGYRVQFIHQTVKDSLVQYGAGLGFHVGKNDYAKSVYDASGFEFLLNACSVKADWSKKLSFDTFNYAKIAEQSADSNANRLKRIADSTSTAMERFIFEDVSKHGKTSLKCNESLLKDIPDLASEWDKLKSWIHDIRLDAPSKMERGKLVLAVAGNLIRFIEYKLCIMSDEFSLSTFMSPDPSFGCNLLCLAAVGPNVSSHGLCNIQNGRMIEALIDGGYDSNDYRLSTGVRDEIYTSCLLPNAPIDTSNSLISPLVALCLRYQFEERKEESELDIAKVLVRKGALINSSLVNLYPKSTDWSLRQNVRLIEFCVRYGSAKW